ncbi:MAG: ferredoxin family protein [Candidatus Hydrothermales bacterium]
MEEIKKNNEVFWRTPLDYNEIKRIKGNVIILEDVCKGCSFCIEFCPTNSLTRSPKLNSKGYHFPIFNPENCTGCGFCERICPEFAIIVEKVEVKK